MKVETGKKDVRRENISDKESNIWGLGPKERNAEGCESARTLVLEPHKDERRHAWPLHEHITPVYYF